MEDNLEQRFFYCWLQTFLVLFITFCVWTQVSFRNERKENDEINKRDAVEVIPNNPDAERAEAPSQNKPAVNQNEIQALRLRIERINREQKVYNADLYGPLKNDSVVLLVQVHNRPEYFKYLVESLSKAKYIDQTLLIFSHDLFNEEINELIRNITFCKVMQIFFPYSVESHPDSFPGDDPRDCPRDIKRAFARKSKCQNAEYPDSYGHYREANITQIKHHWWWKMNYVFNSMNITASYDGPVVFLEEDHYLVEDFVHVLRQMDDKCREDPDCHLLGLGTHEPMIPSKIQIHSDEVRLFAANTNLGLAFNRHAYLNTVLTYAKEFCEYDDYNWDWSLNYVTNMCSKVPILSMIPVVSRIFHVGECGTHTRQKNCEANKIVSKTQDLAKRIDLYPPTLKVVAPRLQKPTFTNNGGWGDKRDQKLCMNMTRR